MGTPASCVCMCSKFHYSAYYLAIDHRTGETSVYAPQHLKEVHGVFQLPGYLNMPFVCSAYSSHITCPSCTLDKGE